MTLNVGEPVGIVKVEKRRWALKALPGQVDEARCVTEFPGPDAWIKENARPAAEVMAEFRDWARDTVKRLGATWSNLTILSDCPHFDLGRLSHLGHVTGTWTNVVEMLDTETRFSTEDPSGRCEEYCSTSTFEEWLKKMGYGHVVHDHYPDHGAEYNCYQMLFCELHRRPPLRWHTGEDGVTLLK
jgi:hypothetical protein